MFTSWGVGKCASDKILQVTYRNYDFFLRGKVYLPQRAKQTNFGMRSTLTMESSKFVKIFNLRSNGIEKEVSYYFNK